MAWQSLIFDDAIRWVEFRNDSDAEQAVEIIDTVQWQSADPGTEEVILAHVVWYSIAVAACWLDEYMTLSYATTQL